MQVSQFRRFKVSPRSRWFQVCLGLLVSLGILLGSCAFFPNSEAVSSSTFSPPTYKNHLQVLWRDDLSGNWMERWQVQQRGAWGTENLKVVRDSTGKFPRVLRVSYPKGSVSPSYARETGAPIGGAQFYAKLGIQPQTHLWLSYDVRFSNNFNFVKGGKLPGLFGGTGASGGQIPDGTDGFSTRFMWRTHGQGEVYAYLPTSDIHGTSLGRGTWSFKPGTWQHIEQEITLNRPGQRDGKVRVWLAGREVFMAQGLVFRTVDSLKLDGIFFSTFFGGNDASWATPQTVYADFANFSVATGPSNGV